MPLPPVAVAWSAAAPSSGEPWSTAGQSMAQAVFLGLLAVGTLLAVGLLVRLIRRPVNWEQRVSRVAWRPCSRGDVWRFAGLLVGLYALADLGAIAFLGRRTGVMEEAGPWMLALRSVTFHWAVVAACAVVLARRGIAWSSAFGLGRRVAWRGVVRGLLIYAASAPFVISYNWVWQYLLQFFGYRPELQPVLQVMMLDAPVAVRIYLVALGVALAPVAEEMLFRGILLPVLVRRFGGAAGVVFGAIVFSALHFHTGSLASLFVVGIALGTAALYTGSLWAPIALHAAFNAVNLALLFSPIR